MDHTIKEPLLKRLKSCSSEDGEDDEILKDKFCDPDNPLSVSFHDVSAAAYKIKEGIQKTPCTVSFNSYLDKSIFCFTCNIFNPFPNSPWFLCVCSTSLLKTLLEKEKLLIMSNFSFSYSVFYPLTENFLPFSSNLKLSSANSLSLEESKICCLGKG